MGNRPTRYTALLAAGVCAGALLTGCGGDDKPSPPPTGGGTVAGGATVPSSGDPGNPTPSVDPTTSSAPSSTKAPTPTTTATPTKPGKDSPDEAGAPGVPPAARQHTKKGAEAFARHYVHIINRTGQHPAVGPLRQLALEGCKGCASFESGVDYMVKHGEHQTGPIFKINRSMVVDDPDQSSVRVRIGMSELPVRVVNKSGKTQRKSHPQDNFLEFMTKWTSTGWRIAKIYVPAT